VAGVHWVKPNPPTKKKAQKRAITVDFLKFNLIFQLYYKNCVNNTHNNGYNGFQINNFLHK